MEFKKEVKESIGPDIFDLFLADIENGRIKQKTVKSIANEMDPKVYGVYINLLPKLASDQLELKDLVKSLFDKWWKVKLCLTDVNGKELFFKILEDDDDLRHLSLKMKPEQGKISDKIPTTHPEIPKYLQHQNETGSKPFVSNQIGGTCASHSIGKAILDYLDDLGIDAVQENIIQALIAEVQPDHSPKNPDEFDKKQIKVRISEKGNADRTEDVTLEVRVLTQRGKVDPTDNIFKTVPITDPDMKMKMVLRWITPYGHHAIYSEHYEMSTETYSCLNSWGKNEPRKPKLLASMIYAIDYISIAKK